MKTLLLGLLAFLSSLQPAINTDALAAEPRSLRVRMIDEPATLDWHKAATGIDAGVIVNLMEGLIRINAKNEAAPALAESWAFSPDRREITLTLRKGMLWSDGVTLEAQHFVDAWKRLLDPRTEAPYAFAVFAIEGAREYNEGALKDFTKVAVSAPDARTLKVRLKEPYPAWLFNLSWWPTFPIRKDLIEKYGETWTQAGNLVGVGPFTLTERVPRQEVILHRNARYLLPHGNVEELELLYIKSDAEALKRFEAGKLDVLPRYTLEGNKLPATDIRFFPPIRTIKMDFNQAKAPMNDPRVRKAIALTLDFTTYPSLRARGYRVARSFVPPGLFGYDPAGGLRGKSAHLTRVAAVQALKAAGYGLGRPLVLEVGTLNADEYTQLGEFIRKRLKDELGIVVNLHSHPPNDLKGPMFTPADRYHAFVYGLSAKSPDPDYLLSSYTEGSPNNHTAWRSADYDEAVRQGRLKPAKTDRLAALVRAQRILQVDEAATVPLVYDDFWVRVRAGVTDYVPNHFSFYRFGNMTVR